jgi:uncharacterized protein YjiS (DUF1127 family)
MSCIAENTKTVSQSWLPSTGATLGWVARRVGAIGRALAGRRVLRELASFDDRMLRDIGLSRSDLRSAAAEPLYRDPTALLAGRVDESRDGRTKRTSLRGPVRVNVISY